MALSMRNLQRRSLCESANVRPIFRCNLTGTGSLFPLALGLLSTPIIHVVPAVLFLLPSGLASAPFHVPPVPCFHALPPFLRRHIPRGQPYDQQVLV